MKDNTDYNDIRRLIARWYEADTGRDEEEALVSFLSSADSLPPDIEKDKELILGLYIPEPEYQDMPEEYSIRISEALETEISKEKVEKEWNRKSIFKIPGSRRMGWAAAVGAVVLLVSV
ncbi:MAG: hypothetical protein K2L89_06710, partial [Muribaculaceae bacterium]|nr:hypothetical protein [Muribaculaceae bacterium]